MYNVILSEHAAAVGITQAAFSTIIPEGAAVFIVGETPINGAVRFHMHADGMINDAPELIVDIDPSGHVELWIDCPNEIYPVTLATGKIGHSYITIDRAAVRRLVSPDLLD